MEMLTSLAIIFLGAILLGSICEKVKLPSLLGMLVTGIILGPYVLDLVAPSILNISLDLRQLALVIILTRAGLNLNFTELKKNGRSAILMCFIPASFEIAGYMIFGVLLLRLDMISALLLGSVMAAVSPAVVVPRMLKLQKQEYGTNKGIPQMITAASSVDDVFVIVLFSAFCGMASGNDFSLSILWKTPVAIILGIVIGLITGYFSCLLFKRVHRRDSVKVLILLSFSFLFIALEHAISEYIPYASLLSVISMGAMVYKNHNVCAKRLSEKYSRLWVAAEILLFVLVGAAVDIKYALASVGLAIATIFLTLIIRIVGVYVCLIKSPFNQKEKLFCAFAYVPKATVQAAIGAIPLAMGLASGSIILTTAVLGILITAPLGAFLIDLTYKKLLVRTSQEMIGNENG